MAESDRPGLVIFVITTDGLGIRAASAAQYSMDKVAAAYEGTAAKVSRMRGKRSRGEPVLDEFTDEERKKTM